MRDLHEFIDSLRKSEKVIIVEGKKDVAALHSLGVDNVYSLNQQPLYKVVEEIAVTHKDCILLTDLDAEGKKLFGNLNSNLQRHGVRVDVRFREFLFKKTKLRQIEGLASYVKNTKQ